MWLIPSNLAKGARVHCGFCVAVGVGAFEELDTLEPDAILVCGHGLGGAGDRRQLRHHHTSIRCAVEVITFGARVVAMLYSRNVAAP
jgi:hypothetical protein